MRWYGPAPEKPVCAVLTRSGAIPVYWPCPVRGHCPRFCGGRQGDRGVLPRIARSHKTAYNAFSCLTLALVWIHPENRTVAHFRALAGHCRMPSLSAIAPSNAHDTAKVGLRCPSTGLALANDTRPAPAHARSRVTHAHRRPHPRTRTRYAPVNARGTRTGTRGYTRSQLWELPPRKLAPKFSPTLRQSLV